MAIIKLIEAFADGPEYYINKLGADQENGGTPNWPNGSYIALSDCGEIWKLEEDEDFFEEDIEEEDDPEEKEGWRAERYVNPLCKEKKNIYRMQMGCRSTFAYTKMYPTKKELLEALDGAINWQGGGRALEFGGKIFHPPDYK